MDQLSLSPRMSRHSRMKLLLGWSILALIGFVLISLAAGQEVSRQTAEISERLRLLDAGQAKNVSGWVGERRDATLNLAQNVSLKLYMSTLAAAPASSGIEEPAELTFLRNLIYQAASSNGFGSIEELAVRANVPAAPGSGMLLQDARGAQIVATRNMPPLSLLPAGLVSTPAKEASNGPFALSGDQQAVAFRQPIFSVQAEPGEGAPVGQLIAVSVLDEKFLKLLEAPVPSNDSAETKLIVVAGDRYASLPAKGGTPDGGSLSASPAIARAIATPGSVIDAPGAQGQSLFAVADQVETFPGWWLVRTENKREALADARQRADWWKISYILAALLVTAAVIAFWRNQSAIRAKESARHYRALAHRIEQQEQMLTLIAETTPVSTYIVDADQRFRYANRKAAEEFRMDRAAIEGKTLAAVLGTARAEEIAAANDAALNSDGSHQSFAEGTGEDGSGRSLVREHIPLSAIPLGAEGENIPGVLVLETDVTSLTQSRERERRTLNQLVGTLVSVVDKRDPHAAHHSACVSLVSHAVAETMQLSAPLPETARIAGQLMNIGKILVPETLLTAERLDGSEKETIRAALQASANLLEGVPFEGPVQETVRQSFESPDGSGPLGLKGEDILVTARIVAVANAYIALISDRAWRDGRSTDEALKVMLGGIGTRYDRAAVAALVTYVESEHGREALTHCMEVKA